MNYQGTNGKWKAVQREKTDYAPKTNEIQFGDDGECVAEFVENDYDAQLIAHAPEMLEFLTYVNICLKEKRMPNAYGLEDLLTRATTINK